MSFVACVGDCCRCSCFDVVFSVVCVLRFVLLFAAVVVVFVVVVVVVGDVVRSTNVCLIWFVVRVHPYNCRLLLYHVIESYRYGLVILI